MDRARVLLWLTVAILVLGYSAFITAVNNRNDPDLRDGVRCLVEQLAQHRIGTRNADTKSAEHHGYDNDPESQPGWHPPPEPTGQDFCSRFFNDKGAR